MKDLLAARNLIRDIHNEEVNPCISAIGNGQYVWIIFQLLSFNFKIFASDNYDFIPYNAFSRMIYCDHFRSHSRNFCKFSKNSIPIRSFCIPFYYSFSINSTFISYERPLCTSFRTHIIIILHMKEVYDPKSFAYHLICKRGNIEGNY